MEKGKAEAGIFFNISDFNLKQGHMHMFCEAESKEAGAEGDMAPNNFQNVLITIQKVALLLLFSMFSPQKRFSPLDP